MTTSTTGTVIQDSILINDVEKGWKVEYAGDRRCTMMDGKRGVIRLIRTPLFFDPTQTEIGSVYAWQITAAEHPELGWLPVTLSPAQEKQKAAVQRWM